MSVKVDEHAKFLQSLLHKEDSFEYLQMAHLKTSAIYWSLTAAVLLNSFDEIYPEDKRKRILEYLERVYNQEDGGFAGNEGAHDSHLLFTLSAIQIMTVLLGKGTYPHWFNLDQTVTCNRNCESTIFSYSCLIYCRYNWIAG